MPLDLEPLELEPVSGKLDLEPLDLEPVEPTSNKAADFARRIPEGMATGTARTIQGAARFADIARDTPPIPFMGGWGMDRAAQTQATVNQQIAAENLKRAATRQQRMEESTAYQFGAQTVEDAQGFYGVDRARDDEFMGQLATAAGEMVPTLAVGALTGPLGAGAQYAASAGESQAQEAIAAGRPETADVAFLAAAGLGGITEAALGVPGRLFAIANRARKAGVNPGSFGQWANRNPVKSGILKAGAEGGVREGVQEGLEQAGGNLIASDLAGYDPNRPVGQGVGRAMALGSTLGVVAGGGAAGVNQVSRNQQAAALREGRTVRLTPDGPAYVVNPETGGTEFGPVDELPAPMVESVELRVESPPEAAQQRGPTVLPDVPLMLEPLEGQPYETTPSPPETLPPEATPASTAAPAPAGLSLAEARKRKGQLSAWVMQNSDRSGQPEVEAQYLKVLGEWSDINKQFPELDETLPTPAPSRELPEVPGVPTPLEGQPYEPAVESPKQKTKAETDRLRLEATKLLVEQRNFHPEDAAKYAAMLGGKKELAGFIADNSPKPSPPPAKAKRQPKAKPTDEYLNEVVNYGGERMTRGQVIARMQSEGVAQPLIDRWLQGQETISKLKPAEVRPAEPQEQPQPPAQAAPVMQEGMDNLRFTSDPVKTAKTGGADAKDAKTKLIAELEKAVSESPFENQSEIQRLNEVLASPPETHFKAVNSVNMGEGFEARYTAEFDRAKQLLSRLGRVPKPVTIEIPGDGTFTVANTKEDLGKVLAAARRLQTATSSRWEGPSTARPRLNAREWISKVEEDAERVYGARRAITKLREQAANPDLEMEPEMREQLQAAAENLESRLPEHVAEAGLGRVREQIAEVRDSIANAEGERLAHKAEAKQLLDGTLKPRRGRSARSQATDRQIDAGQLDHKISQLNHRLKELTKREAETEAELSKALSKASPQPGIVQQLDAAIESAKIKPGGLFSLPDLGLTVTLWNGTLNAVQLSLRAGQRLAQAIQSGIDWLRAQGQPFDEAKVRAALEQAILQSPGVREHVGKRLLQEDFSPAAKAAVEKLLLHEVKPDEQLFAEAAAVIEAVGPREALASYFGNPWGLPQDSHVVLGFALGNALSTLETQARAAGDTATANRIGQENAEFQSQFVLQSTETARTLRAYRYFDLVGNLSPFTADVFARKVIEKANAQERNRLKPTLDEVGDQLGKANQQAVDDAAGDKGVQGTARTVINQAIEAEAKALNSPIRHAIAAEVIAQLQAAGRLSAVEAAIVREHFSTNPEALDLAAKLERAGVKQAKARAAELNGKFEAGVDAFRAKLKQKLAEARQQNIDPATLGIVDKAIRQRLAQMQVRLGALVRQHWSQVERTGKTLAEKMVAEVGLPPEQAQRLADAIERRFKALATAKKEALLRNLAKTPAARQLQKQSVSQRIIEFSNLGAFDSEGLWNAVAEKLGLASYSADASAEVKRLAEKAQQLPEGSVQRQEATARLMRFIARQHGLKLGDLGWAFWYANTLSGPITHMVNIGSNALSLAGNVTTQFRDVRGIPQILAATAKGFRTGTQEARAILRQGPGANRTKFTEQGQALENLDPQDFTGAGLMRQWRVVARALAAADAAFYFPAREAKAITLARALARQEGKTGAAIGQQARETLDGTEQQQNLWGAQVDRERAQLESLGEKPDALWSVRRLEQLREQAWGAEIGEAADDFALRTTYNNQPYGLIGAMADVAKFAQRKVPGVRLIVPFVNIVANVTNESINYTPWGFARAYAAGQTGVPSVNALWSEKLRNGQTPLTPDAVIDLHTKAALGTALVGGIVAAAIANLDDDDGENFQLYGQGPKDPAARKAWKETGAIPYSVRVNGKYISIANTPLAIPLGAMGNYLDAMRWDKRFDQANAFNRLGVALWGGAHVITQQSFLDSAARLAGAIENPRGRSDTLGDRGLAEALRSGGNLVIPNALRQLDRMFDPTLYDNRGIEGALVASIPFARRTGSPALNAFGEPITSSPWARFASDAKANVWADLAHRGVYPSTAEKVKNRWGREMTDDEHYRYVELSGQAIKRRLETPGMRAKIRTGEEQELRKTLTGIVKDEREKARTKLGF